MAPRFDLIGLVVADLAASLAFYRRLGIDVPADADGLSHVEATLPGGLRIAWDTVETVRSFDPGWTPPGGGHRVGLAFRCDDPADVDRQYAGLVRAGHTGYLEPWDAFWGQRYAVVLDPDGNSVDLFAPLPGGTGSPDGPDGGQASASSTES
ncbi:VOC family protein [Streptomyces sp. URMC 125]|uniref:VOC family protein n=1 Tax=Streptomyces sp. URMC 125 TaxID=3423419 RepID=UPI003F1D612D